MFCECGHHFEDHTVVEVGGGRECDHADCTCTDYADEHEWEAAQADWELEQEAREYARIEQRN